MKGPPVRERRRGISRIDIHFSRELAFTATPRRFQSGNGIKTARMKRVAFQQSPESEDASLKGSVSYNRLAGIVGAGRVKSTARTQNRR
jgi:hypothetical protein